MRTLREHIVKKQVVKIREYYKLMAEFVRYSFVRSVFLVRELTNLYERFILLFCGKENRQ